MYLRKLGARKKAHVAVCNVPNMNLHPRWLHFSVWLDSRSRYEFFDNFLVVTLGNFTANRRYFTSVVMRQDETRLRSRLLSKCRDNIKIDGQDESR